MPTGAKYLVIYFVKNDLEGYDTYLYAIAGTSTEAENLLDELMRSYKMSCLEKPESLPKASIVKVVKEVH